MTNGGALGLGIFRRILRQRDHVVLKTELAILAAHDITVIPLALHSTSVVIGSAPVLDTPRLGLVDFPAYVFINQG
jgi:hypothetical protein